MSCVFLLKEVSMKTNILGIEFDNIDMEKALDILMGFFCASENHIIVTPNPEGVMQAKRNEDFAIALKSADLRLADGIGIVIASRLGKSPLKSRVRGYDTTIGLFNRLQSQAFTAYFLGAKPQVAEKAAKYCEEKYKGLTVVGCHHGYFEDDLHIINEINKLSPDILLVCLGMPRAEIWAYKNKNINTRITLCVGGTIDVLAGNVHLAPNWIRKIGFEWLYRFIKQPSRIKRMIDIPRFVFAVLYSKINRVDSR